MSEGCTDGYIRWNRQIHKKGEENNNKPNNSPKDLVSQAKHSPYWSHFTLTLLDIFFTSITWNVTQRNKFCVTNQVTADNLRRGKALFVITVMTHRWFHGVNECGELSSSPVKCFL